MKKRVLSVIVTLAMCLALLPLGVITAGATEATTEATVGGYTFEVDEDGNYLISSVEDWNNLAEAVAANNNCSGLTFKLTTDIGSESAPIEKAIGRQTSSSRSDRKRFAGTFDGDNHTITVALSSADDWFKYNPNYVSPFAYLSNATIKNVHVVGTITTTGQFASGLVGSSGAGKTDGACTVEHCQISVTIINNYQTSGSTYANHGGVIAIAESTATIKDTWFDGAFTGIDYSHSGGFVGLNKGTQAKPTTLTNCLFDPSPMPDGLDVTGACEFVHESGENTGYHTLADDVYFVNHFGELENAQGRHVVSQLPDGFTGTSVTAADGGTYYIITGSEAWAALTDFFNNLPDYYYALSENVTAGSEDDALVVPAGETFTLELNGNTIDRALTMEPARSDGFVIKVSENALLAINGPGVITGGNNTGDGGGIYVEGGGELILNDVTISDNLTAGSGGGVYVSNGGTLTVNGVTVTGNTGKTIGAEGMGIYVSEGGAFNLAGDVTITNNLFKRYTSKANKNVYLGNGVKIHLNGNLTASTPIGVTMATPGVFTENLSSNAHLSNFASEDATCIKGSENGEAKLIKRYEITFKNYDGTQLQKGYVNAGETPVYNGATLPQKPEDDDYTYSFNKWEPDLADATADATYTATYTATPKQASLTEYEVENGKIYFNEATGAIVASDEDITAAVIPETINDAAVTAIGDGAFADRTDLTTVTIPWSVTAIAADAFDGCTSLAAVNFGGSEDEWDELTAGLAEDSPLILATVTYTDDTNIPFAVTGGNIYFDKTTGAIVDADDSITAAVITAQIHGVNVTSIGERAFEDCADLESVTLPDTLTSIGTEAFWACTSLTEINADANNTTFASDGGVLFNKDKTALLIYPAGKTDTTYTVPDTVTSIGEYAFESCSNLETISISENVETIGYSAFGYCDVLKTVTIPASVTSIGSYAFTGCTSLTEISVDENNTAYSSDDYGVLFNKDKTTLVAYPAGKTDTSYEVPDTVTEIGVGAFMLASLTSVTLPQDLEQVGAYAFDNCIVLDTVNYGGTEDEWDAFAASGIGTGNECLTGAQTINFTQAPAPTTYTVKFTDTDGTAFANIDDQEVEAGGKAQKPADPQKNGFSFKAWYNGNTEYSFDSPVNSNLTLTASWEEWAPGTLGAVNLRATVDGRTIVLNWDAVEGADVYRIYREASGTAWSVLVKSTDGLTYTDNKDVVMGVKYYYTMRAAKTGEKFIKNPAQTTVNATIPIDLPGVPITSIAWSESGVVLTWDAVDDAQDYRVYRKPNTGTSTWDIVETKITGTTYTDTSSLTSGTKYYYKVRAGSGNKYPKVTGETARSIIIP
ncbi:MAG: leucine-rich repeat protein [Clostridia bacterium]|nr:leucine-rich repeat protein [Clostridia bacterium]